MQSVIQYSNVGERVLPVLCASYRTCRYTTQWHHNGNIHHVHQAKMPTIAMRNKQTTIAATPPFEMPPDDGAEAALATHVLPTTPFEMLMHGSPTDDVLHSPLDALGHPWRAHSTDATINNSAKAESALELHIFINCARHEKGLVFCHDDTMSRDKTDRSAIGEV